MMKQYVILTLFFSFILQTLSYSQENKKDSLYFNYDENYLKKDFLNEPNYLFVEDSGSDSEYFFFIKKSVFKDLYPKEVLNLKEYIRASVFYNEEKKLKLNDYRLYEYFKNYTIFLIRNENCKKEYILVEPMMVTE